MRETAAEVPVETSKATEINCIVLFVVMSSLHVPTCTVTHIINEHRVLRTESIAELLSTYIIVNTPFQLLKAKVCKYFA